MVTYIATLLGLAQINRSSFSSRESSSLSADHLKYFLHDRNSRKKMEETRDQLVDALYQKCLALAEIESLKVQHLCISYFLDINAFTVFILLFVTNVIIT
jgi:hypothetical protein